MTRWTRPPRPRPALALAALLILLAAALVSSLGIGGAAADGRRSAGSPGSVRSGQG